jgi:hypothetical protein
VNYSAHQASRLEAKVTSNIVVWGASQRPRLRKPCGGGMVIP